MCQQCWDEASVLAREFGTPQYVAYLGLVDEHNETCTGCDAHNHGTHTLAPAGANDTEDTP